MVRTSSDPARKGEVAARDDGRPADSGGRFDRLWGLDAAFERSGPTRRQQRRDVLGAVALVLVGALVLELMRGLGYLRSSPLPPGLDHAVAAVMLLPLAARRRFPQTTLIVMSVLFIGVGSVVPGLALSLAFQAGYFCALYTAVAWAPDRRLLAVTVGVVLVAMFLWLAIGLTVGSSARESSDAFVGGPPDGVHGLLPSTTSWAIYNLLVNVAYFGGAIFAGLVSWRDALARDQLAAAADRIRDQADRLARQAVLDERLRIARELHDVVAHHVSVIGVQAAAARRLLRRDPDTAETALRAVEGSSREAVGQMRSLLGVLRSRPDEQAASRAPEPGLADVRSLVDAVGGPRVRYHAVEHEPGALDRVPAPVGLSAYRTVQESLSNIRRHSTATTARVSLRTWADETGTWLEVETVDDGRPRPGTAGTGYGLQGVRERVVLHHGSVEAGPRTPGGWRVRARFRTRAVDAGAAGPASIPDLEPGTADTATGTAGTAETAETAETADTATAVVTERRPSR